ncbi:hypothetical protein G9444_6759 (plasmid) [Rhodococcus erythropolis]|uniref:Uncharacterized protein n=1 Tax=Rhodococcus erythropolis TaxID=1833 RepID=A0A6G9D4I3_RHOER|nr:hypothetical protein G9444_6759 [Rhodococcus erythropolis]
MSAKLHARRWSPPAPSTPHREADHRSADHLITESLRNQFGNTAIGTAGPLQRDAGLGRYARQGLLVDKISNRLRRSRDSHQGSGRQPIQ